MGPKIQKIIGSPVGVVFEFYLMVHNKSETGINL